MWSDTHEAIVLFVVRRVPGLHDDAMYRALLEWSTAPDRRDQYPGLFPRTHHTGGGLEWDVRTRALRARSCWLGGDGVTAAAELGVAFHWVADEVCPSASEVWGDRDKHQEFEAECARAFWNVAVKMGDADEPLSEWGKARTLAFIEGAFADIRSGEHDSPTDAVRVVLCTCLQLARAICQPPQSTELSRLHEAVLGQISGLRAATLREKWLLERQENDRLAESEERRRRGWWGRLRPLAAIARWLQTRSSKRRLVAAYHRIHARADDSAQKLAGAYEERRREEAGWFALDAVPTGRDLLLRAGPLGTSAIGAPQVASAHEFRPEGQYERAAGAETTEGPGPEPHAGTVPEAGVPHRTAAEASGPSAQSASTVGVDRTGEREENPPWQSVQRATGRGFKAQCQVCGHRWSPVTDGWGCPVCHPKGPGGET